MSVTLSDARDEGYDAFYSDEGVEANPYSLGSPAYREWLRGWHDAQTDDLEDEQDFNT